MENKIEIVNYLKRLSEYEMIKIDGTDKERLVFKNRDEVFNIFGAEEKDVLNPFNDITYSWLHSFLSAATEHISRSNADNYDELRDEINDILPEWVDLEVDIYTADLTAWLANNNANIAYLEDAIKEYPTGENHLQMAQYKAIEELFNNALHFLIEDLKAEFEEAQQ